MGNAALRMTFRKQRLRKKRRPHTSEQDTESAVLVFPISTKEAPIST